MDQSTTTLISSISSTSTSNSPPPTTTTRSLGTLSILPPELRNFIYDFLTPSASPSSPSSPFSASKALADRIGVAAVSHLPPPTNFLLASKTLCGEARDVYFRKTVFTVERVIDTFCPWPIFGIEETLAKGMGRGVLEGLRRVRVEVFWQWLPEVGMSVGSVLGDFGGGGGFECPREMEVRNRIERMERLVDVLCLAGELKFFCLVWREVAPLRVEGDEDDFAWEVEARKRVLEPLRRLSGFRGLGGDVVAGGEVGVVIGDFLGEMREGMREGGRGGGDGWW